MLLDRHAITTNGAVTMIAMPQTTVRDQYSDSPMMQMMRWPRQQQQQRMLSFESFFAEQSSRRNRDAGDDQSGNANAKSSMTTIGGREGQPSSSSSFAGAASDSSSNSQLRRQGPSTDFQSSPPVWRNRHHHHQHQQQHQREYDGKLDDKDHGHRYGNFPNYSNFHPPQARLQVLTSTGILHHIRHGLLQKLRYMADPKQVGEDHLQLSSENISNDDEDDDSDEKVRKRGHKRLRMTYNAADSPSSLKSLPNTKCNIHVIYYCDLGCNSGELTADVASSLLLDDGSATTGGDGGHSMVINVLGVDIDPKLVKRANANFEDFASSLISGSKASLLASERDNHTNINSDNTATTNAEGEDDDIAIEMKSTSTTTRKSTNARMTATFMECDLNSDIEHNAACTSFLANVVEQKEAKDGGEGVVAVGDGNQQTTQHPPLPPSGRLFHLTTIFSTTMWIHVHGGDDGLRSFLVRACQWTANYLLVEPQPSGW